MPLENNLFRRLFVLPTDNLLLQLMRYTFVGGVAFVVDFALLYILTEYCHFYYIASATISFIAGLLVNYIISILWVFRGFGSVNRFQEFLFFALIGVIGLGINAGLLWVITDCFGVYYMLSKLITAVIVYLWNFFARKYLLFSKRSE